MRRRPPESTRTATLLPYTPRFRSVRLWTDPAPPTIGPSASSVTNPGRTWRIEQRVAKTADDSLLRIDLTVRPESGRGQAVLTIIRPSRSGPFSVPFLRSSRPRIKSGGSAVLLAAPAEGTALRQAQGERGGGAETPYRRPSTDPAFAFPLHRGQGASTPCQDRSTPLSRSGAG